jgi:hypothetical protein
MWPFTKAEPEDSAERIVEVIRRDPLRLRLHEFRSNKNLVSSAQKMMAMPEFRLMLDVLMNEHPLNFVLAASTTEERAAQQARGEGYTIAIRNLEAMADLQQIVSLGEPEFLPEEKHQPQIPTQP